MGSTTWRSTATCSGSIRTASCTSPGDCATSPTGRCSGGAAGLPRSEDRAAAPAEDRPVQALRARRGVRRPDLAYGYHMMMARTQTLVQLSDDLLERLDRLRDRAGRSRSELIREAVEQYLAVD